MQTKLKPIRIQGSPRGGAITRYGDRKLLNFYEPLFPRGRVERYDIAHGSAERQELSASRPDVTGKLLRRLDRAG